MPVDPIIQPILDAINAAGPPDRSLPVAERREMANAAAAKGFIAMSEPGPDMASITDHTVAVEGGEITVRVFVPKRALPLPVHVNFHGGGWFMGTLELDEAADAMDRCGGRLHRGVGRLPPRLPSTSIRQLPMTASPPWSGPLTMPRSLAVTRRESRSGAVARAAIWPPSLP